MASSVAPWPCPVCVGLLPPYPEDCPHCQLPAAWLDLLLALGFAVRQLHYWTIIGGMSRPQYQAIVESVRRRQDAMASAAVRGEAVPAGTGLPSRAICWRCQRPCPSSAQVCSACNAALASPEARLFRYQTFLCKEVQGHSQAGRLSAAQAEQFLKETRSSLAEMTGRVQAT